MPPLTPVAPLASFASAALPAVFLHGGSVSVSVLAFSAIGFLYRSKRSVLRDLLLPADHATPPATRRLLTDISAPSLVSSTNAASDPYYFERHLPRHKSTPSLGRTRSLALFHGSTQDSTDMMSLSVYSCDSADPERHALILSTPTIPRIALQDLSDHGSTTSLKNTYDFEITAVGSSLRQGDFLQLPNRSWPRLAHSRSLPAPRGPRHAVRVVDIAKYSHALAAPVRRLPAVQVARQDFGCQDTTPANEDDMLLAFIETADLSFESSEDDTEPAHPDVAPPGAVRFRGRHRRSRAASYQIAPGTPTERGDLVEIEPFSSNRAEDDDDDDDARWAPKDGMIVVKVYLPSTDEIWAAYVPATVTLAAFTCRWLCKLRVGLRFSASAMDAPECYFDDDDAFRYWVDHRRIWRGRNVPIVGHLDC